MPTRCRLRHRSGSNYPMLSRSEPASWARHAGFPAAAAPDGANSGEGQKKRRPAEPLRDEANIIYILQLTISTGDHLGNAIITQDCLNQHINKSTPVCTRSLTANKHNSRLSLFTCPSSIFPRRRPPARSCDSDPQMAGNMYIVF